MKLSQLADYHVHTPLCRHATGEPTEFAKRAKEMGLAEIGFSDHSPMTDDSFDDWRMLLKEFPIYCEQVMKAREAVTPFPVRLGLEVDYLENGEPWIEQLSTMAPFDYLIGAVHYIAPGWDIDNPKWIGRWSEGSDVEDIWQNYWRLFGKCAASGLFDLLAHPDLPKKFGHRPTGDLRRYYEPAISAAADANVAIEINTAGWRKQCDEQYPARLFLELMHEAGIPLSISSDAHAPNEVGADFERAAKLALDIGFTHTVRFETRNRTLVPLEQHA